MRSNQVPNLVADWPLVEWNELSAPQAAILLAVDDYLRGRFDREELLQRIQAAIEPAEIPA